MVDAIREDASSGKNEDGTIKDINDPSVRYSRNEAMAAMLARRKETVQADMSEDARTAFQEGERVPGNADDGDTDAGLEINPDPATQAAAAGAVVNGQDFSKSKFKIKVNGVEQDTTFEEIVRMAQKNSAADRYLADAATMRADAERLLNDATAKAAAVAAATPAKPAEPVKTSDEIRASVREVVHGGLNKLFVGDDGGAADDVTNAVVTAIEALLPRQAQAPTIDVNAIAKQVSKQIANDGAVRQFTEDFQDLMAEERYRIAADQQIAIRTSNRGLDSVAPADVAKLLADVGHATRRLFDLKDPEPVSGKASTSTREAIAAKKEMIDELPHASVRSSTTVPQPRTTADVINDMKIKRGQLAVDQRMQR